MTIKTAKTEIEYRGSSREDWYFVSGQVIYIVVEGKNQFWGGEYMLV